MDYPDICDKKKQKVPARWQVLNTPIGVSCTLSRTCSQEEENSLAICEKCRTKHYPLRNEEISNSSSDVQQVILPVTIYICKFI